MLRKNNKADSILGRKPSDEKLQRVLDISEDELAEIEEENAMRREEELEQKRQRQKIPIRNETKKAMEFFGKNLSDDKVKQLLGIDDAALAQAKEESAALVEESFGKIREKEKVSSQKATKKALEVLGLPKELKAKEWLGLNDEEFEDAVKNRAERQEEWIANVRTSQDTVVIDRMVESTKFIPTGDVSKAKRILGFHFGRSDSPPYEQQHQQQQEQEATTLGADESPSAVSSMIQFGLFLFLLGFLVFVARRLF